MLQIIIPALIIIIALAIVIIVFLRHFPQAAAIDLDTLPAEQEAAMKAALMEKRLKRKVLSVKNKIVPFFRKRAQIFRGWFKRTQKRLTQLEQQHRIKPHRMSVEQQEDVKQKIRQWLAEAKDLKENENFVEAENKYIEILSWDAKNLDAYFNLGELYITKKEFSQAKETFMYLIRLVQSQKSGDEQISRFSSPLTESQINESYYDYALCLQVLGGHAKAYEQLSVVLERDANNPKYIDKAVELSILLKNRVDAELNLKKLRDVNPENQKIAGYEEQIKNI